MKKALVIVSFGTTYERARRSIDAVERALAQAAEGHDVFRAYTSSIVRKVLKSRGEIVPSLEEALEKLANESYDTVFVQPTHLLCGNEYDEKIRASYMRYAGRFLRGGIGKPLIANNDDLLKLAEILAALKPDDADALLLMGHGTTHFANMVYPAMQTALRLQGHPNVVVGTVEGWPTLENAIDELRALGAKHIELRPMMLVAGDHAQNDMAGDDADSWKSHLTAAGFDVFSRVVWGARTAVIATYGSVSRLHWAAPIPTARAYMSAASDVAGLPQRRTTVTSAPASISLRATTKPSPPLLPLPHRTDTFRPRTS